MKVSVKRIVCSFVILFVINVILIHWIYKMEEQTAWKGMKKSSRFKSLLLFNQRVKQDDIQTRNLNTMEILRKSIFRQSGGLGGRVIDKGFAFLQMLFPLNNNKKDFKIKWNIENFTNIINYRVSLDNLDVSNRIQLQLNANIKATKRTKTILVYFNDKHMTTENFVQSNCPVKNCKFAKQPEDYEAADAVLFKEVPHHLKRPKLKPNQLWIYYQLESPLHSKPIPNGIKINWTATYRPDSVLQTPYGKYLPSRTPRNNNNAQINYATGKTKLVAWFVSNCQDKNGRLNYVKELQTFIPVDIYGDCGPLKCNRKDCNKMLKRDYKFYLSFENSNCRGYITEKLFNAYSNDVVPIVMGAHQDDYSATAPAHSYIHIDQFETPKKLAKYIKLLNTNDAMYNEYFRWKTKGVFSNTHFMCRLCVMLDTVQYVQITYRDINTWWRTDQCNLLKSNGRNWTTWRK